MSQSLSVGYLLGLFGVVSFGAVIPVVPTGAAVSVGAVLSEQDHVLLLLVVIGVGAAGAYLGDLITYAVLRLAGRPLAQRLGWLKEEAANETLERLRAQVEAHELRVLLLSRLIPGGRVPVLLAAALGGYSWRRFAVADLGAAALWSAVYAAIGLAGRSVFGRPWEGIVAAIALVLVVSAIGQLVSRRSRRVLVAPPPR
jgi:membrane protein DedA with SNARE-associated domain